MNGPPGLPGVIGHFSYFVTIFLLVAGLFIVIARGNLIKKLVGLAGLFLGGNYLDYFVLDHDPAHGQHRGIFWVEVGVAVTVSGVMLKIFYMFASRGRDPE